MHDKKKHLTIDSVIDFHTCIPLCVWVGCNIAGFATVGGEGFFALPASTEVGTVFGMMIFNEFSKQ